MGRMNNRRTQAAAQANKNTPSRARFSQPPPRRTKASASGRGDGASASAAAAGGRDGAAGRGGGASAATKAAVVNKIAQRVQHKKPAEGQSLAGIDKSKLDELTLSEASVDLITKLLKDLNVVQVPATRKEATTTGLSAGAAPFAVGAVPTTLSSASSVADTTIHNDYNEDGDLVQAETVGYHGQQSGTAYTENVYGGDDENGWYEDAQETEWEGAATTNRGATDNDDDGGGGGVDDNMQRDPIFCHLTVQLSFSEANAARAVQQGQVIQASTAVVTPAVEDSNTDRTKLANALDWLCLHLTEKELEAGFQRNPGGLEKLTAGAYMKNGRGGGGKGIILVGTGGTRAIPHPSITVAKKLTEDTEWRKLARLEERVVGFLRLGFLSAEAMQACDKTDSDSSSPFVEAIRDGKTLQLLLAALEREVLEDKVQSDFTGSPEEKEAAALEREMEREALSAIYDDQFEILDLDDGHGRYKARINPADESEADLHVFVRPGYPGSQVPRFLLQSPSLPPPVLRRVNAAIIREAQENVGVPVIFDVVTFVEANLTLIHQDFVKEQRAEDFEAEQRRLRKAAGHDVEVDDDNHDGKQSGRRQQSRLKAAAKAYDKGDTAQREQQERRLRQKERLQLVKHQESNIRYSRAERAIMQREKERMDEELKKVGRVAMNASFNRGESVEEARAATQLAEKSFRHEHGLEYPSDISGAHSLGQSGKTAEQKDHACVDHNVGDDDEADGHTIENVDSLQKLPQATGTTMAFMDRLRGMYSDAKANGGKSTGVYSVIEPKVKASTKGGEIIDAKNFPRPVAVPVGDLAKVMEDVVTVQTEQPWLVSEEARVPGAVSKYESLTPQQLQKRRELSKNLRDELEKKYRASAGSKGFQKMLTQRKKLPAYQMRKEIVATVERCQITVIAGDTGCGKTTQVPQLVLDNFVLQNRGSETNIIVTQPRRISAIGVSERIALERGERIGDTCGYSIKLEKKMSKKTRLLLCTTGILLRRLQCDPDLASVSHVFVDEVHERDLNTDFLLIILKDLLARRKSLKLVLMSATLNSERFQGFFHGFCCEVVSIPGRAHPVQEFRLEDILRQTGYEVKEHSDYVVKKSSSSTNRLTKSALRKMYFPKGYDTKVIHSLSIVDEAVINYELLADLLEHISLNKDEGAILVFLPGMAEIAKAIDEMRRKELFQSEQVLVYPLHSALSTSEQTAVFNVPPSGVRKIVVATNIAETSITIEDVVYVIDAGRVKESRRDEVKETPALVECWVSRASAKQRRGRAGRVRPGIAYHMYSSHTHDSELQDYQLPEILRVGLEDLALQVLILDLGEPHDFLARAMDPPSALAMRNSLKLLEELGAVECDWQNSKPIFPTQSRDEGGSESCGTLSVSSELTALGFHLAMLPVEPRVGKMMIYGALLGCVEPALTIAASMSSKNPFISPFDSRDAANVARQQFSTEDSDHLTILTAFNEWKDIRRKKGERSAQAFLRDNFLSSMTLFQMEELRKQYSKLLVDIGFLPGGFHLKGKGRGKTESPAGGSNANASNLALVKAVLCAGLYPNIIVAPRPLVDGSSKREAGEYAFQSRNKGEVYLHPCTISFTSKKLASRYCCFHEIVRTRKTYVRDTSCVSPFALVLFGGALEVYHEEGVATVDGWLKFRSTAKPATLVKHLRAQMERMLLRKIIAPEDDVTESPEAKALIEAISTLLRHETQGATASSELEERLCDAEIARQWLCCDNLNEQSSGGSGRGSGRGRKQDGRGGGRGRSSGSGSGQR